VLRRAVVAAAVTAATVTTGVALHGTDAQVQAAADVRTPTYATLRTLDLDELRESRQPRVSRSARRITLQPQATGHRYATAPLKVRTGPGERPRRVGLLEKGTRVAVTGQVVGHWAEVLMPKSRVRWVNADHLARHKPKPPASPEPEPESAVSVDTAADSSGATTGGLSSAPCPDGSTVESGLTSNAVLVYRAVCAAFPQPTTYGGYDPHGEHIDGRAIDIMIGGDVGYQIADWLRANAGALAVRDIIYAQRIWTPERAAEGWRYMSDRGSTTANHYDHVHVAVY
jgi:hypothetical protein